LAGAHDRKEKPRAHRVDEDGLDGEDKVYVVPTGMHVMRWRRRVEEDAASG
jgi:hypothetical protein